MCRRGPGGCCQPSSASHPKRFLGQAVVTWELKTEDPVDVSSLACLWAAAGLAACNLLIVTFISAFNSLVFFPFLSSGT